MTIGRMVFQEPHLIASYLIIGEFYSVLSFPHDLLGVIPGMAIS